jgi:hypothetical protein
MSKMTRVRRWSATGIPRLPGAKADAGDVFKPSKSGRMQRQGAPLHAIECRGSVMPRTFATVQGRVHVTDRATRRSLFATRAGPEGLSDFRWTPRCVTLP